MMANATLKDYDGGNCGDAFYKNILGAMWKITLLSIMFFYH